MFNAEPLFNVASNGLYVSGDVLQRKGSFLLIGRSQTTGFNHRTELEWALDIDGDHNYHVEDVTLYEQPEPDSLSMEFNFRKWGYNYANLKSVIAHDIHLKGYLRCVLSLRICGFLIDAWQIEAIISSLRSYSNGRRISLKANVIQKEQLPRVEYDFEFEQLSNSTKGTFLINKEPYMFYLYGRQFDTITPRQLLVNLIKEHPATRVYRRNDGVIYM